jgi:hypothetical protein
MERGPGWCPWGSKGAEEGSPKWEEEEEDEEEDERKEMDFCKDLLFGLALQGGDVDVVVVAGEGPEEHGFKLKFDKTKTQDWYGFIFRREVAPL